MVQCRYFTSITRHSDLGMSKRSSDGWPSGPPPADRRLALTGHLPASFLPVRQGPVRPNEVTGVAVGIFLQIVLMLGLGLPERSDRCHLGDNLARPKAGSIDIGDGVFCDPFLLVVLIEDGRPIGRVRHLAAGVAHPG